MIVSLPATPEFSVKDISIKKRLIPSWQRKADKENPSQLGLKARNAISINLSDDKKDSNLKGQVFSDVHLYLPSKLLNNAYRAVKIGGQDHILEPGIDPTRFPASVALQQMNKLPIAERPDILFFNGDTFEILGSCIANGFVPINAKGELTNKEKTIEVFKNILRENWVFVEQLRKFLVEKPNAKIVFVIGNHDELLAKIGELRDTLYKALLRDQDPEENRIVFCNIATCPELKLYMEHGHLIEDQSHSDYGAATMCDALSLACEILPRAVLKEIEQYETEIADDIQRYRGENGLLDSFKNIIGVLKNRVENFIFLAEVPPIKEYLKSCFQKTINTLRDLNLPEPDRLSAILQDKVFNRLGKIFQDNGVTDFYHSIFANSRLKKMLAWAMGYSRDGLEERLNKETFQDKFLKAVNQKREKKGDNKIQADEALRIKKEFPVFDFFSFGHTHKKNHNDNGDSYESKKLKRKITHFNTGLAHRNIKSTQKRDGSWDFEQEDHNGSSLIVERQQGGTSARTYGYDELLTQAV